MKFVNEIQLYYQKTQLPIPFIASSKLAYQNAKWIFEQTNSQIELKEYFFLMLINNRNELIGYYKLSEGGMTGTVVDIRIAFAAILKSLSVAVILIHNHPSGTLKPSGADKAITKKFIDAGNFFDIKVLDHLIITPESYYSFADEGVL